MSTKKNTEPLDETLPEQETTDIIERAWFSKDISLLNTPFLRAQFIRRIGRHNFHDLAEAQANAARKVAR